MAHTKVPITAVKLIPYFIGNSEKVAIIISLARICVTTYIALIAVALVLVVQFV